ncbi:MAG: hypothetical protein KME46_21450 [Brasilonema angustatum HA4187-MV1]|jgi:hypothetical protein|nr:hypothetical protein [Brasilonema angustatum HA4187-MV1]
MNKNLLITADNLFPEVVQEVLKDYPSIRESVDTYRDFSKFETSYHPQQVNVYFDDCWVAGWKSNGQVDAIPNLLLTATARPEVVEIEVDGEPGLILVQGVEVLNRIEKISGHELWLVDFEATA